MFAVPRKCQSWWIGIVLCTAVFAWVGSRQLLAQDEPAAAASDVGPAAESTEVAAVAVVLPPYFSGTNADPEKPIWPDAAGGAAGVWATPAGDGKGDVPSSLTITDVYDRVAHNLFSINMVWTLITGAMVMFMQAGFSMVEGGLSRQKNACHTWSMNFMIYPLGGLGFWIYGFAIGWGNWFNGPVPPGWYASLGPGLAVLNQGVGMEPGTDAADARTEPSNTGCWGPRASSCMASTTSA